jgi:beta-glucosidase
MLAEAHTLAATADAIILALGEAKEHSGESSTRVDITLPGAQPRLVREMAQVAKDRGIPLILLVISGRPLALTEEAALSDALIWTGHPGAEGGPAIAEILFGDRAPEGRLSISLPRHVGQLPLRIEDLPSGRPQDGIGVDVYGDSEIDATGRHVFRKFTTACILESPHTPLYPAGFGLGYTSFAHGQPQLSATELQGAAAVLDVTLDITNTGTRAGTETVQLYLRDPVAEISRPLRELKGFARLTLAPGETGTARFQITAADLEYDRGPDLAQMRRDWEGGAFRLNIGPHALDTQEISIRWTK